ncbi:hypothetical protein CsatB_014565 [Cannabis sativa]
MSPFKALETHLVFGPTIFFYDVSNNVKKLYNYVDNYLKNLKKDVMITSFKLYMIGFYYRRSKAEVLDKWLAFAVENKVKELHFCLDQQPVEYMYSSHHYILPKFVLQNSRNLTILKLDGVEVDTSSYSFSFPSLKTLSLGQVRRSDNAEVDVVFQFLLGSPSLEKLMLLNYCFLGVENHPPLRSLSLKFFELEISACLFVVKFEAINLETLLLHRVSLDNYNFTSCKKIRNLSLVDCSESDRPILEDLISSNPLLENLTLKSCTSDLDHLKISGQHLKCFSFTDCEYVGYNVGIVRNITVESAPRLEYFSYLGHINCTISTASCNLLNGKIVITSSSENYNTFWFTLLLNFLMNLNCSWNIVILGVYTVEALVLPEKLKRISISEFYSTP